MSPHAAPPNSKVDGRTASRWPNNSVVSADVEVPCSVRGQFDAEGGAALTAALDALMKPPGPDDTRTPAQRRADAMVELARIEVGPAC
jgi:hypothetical protein